MSSDITRQAQDDLDHYITLQGIRQSTRSFSSSDYTRWKPVDVRRRKRYMWRKWAGEHIRLFFRMCRWFIQVMLPTASSSDTSFRKNIRTVFSSSYFKPFRLAFVSWSVFSLCTIVFGGYAFLYAPVSFGASIVTWSFDSASNYSFDDTKIEVLNGSASLLAFDQIDNANDISGFASGTFSNTEWDGTLPALTLSTGFSTGNFTSRIMDATSLTIWNAISWLPNRPIHKPLPDNNGQETAYTSGNVNMSNNLLLFHFDQQEANGDFVDTSGSGALAQCGGATCPTVVSGKFNNAISFDPTAANALDLADSSFLNGKSQLTYGGWFKKETGTHNYAKLMERGTSGGVAELIGLQIAGPPLSTNGLVAIIENNDGLGRISIDGVITPGEWFHAITVFDGTQAEADRLKLYVNGVLQVVTLEGTPPTTTATDVSPMHLGANTVLNKFYFKGQMDELVIFDRAFSAAEIQSLYERGVGDMTFQVRSCDDVACSGESFVGPDGTVSTVFSEEQSTSVSLPSFSYTVPNNRYFQYKTFFDAPNSSLVPFLSSVSISPDHYSGDAPSITNTLGRDYIDLHVFSATESGDVVYQITNTTSAWYWYDGTVPGWVTTTLSSPLQANTAAIINTNTSSFVSAYGSGFFYFTAFLKNPDGISISSVSDVSLNYDSPTVSFVTSSGEGLESVVSSSIAVAVSIPTQLGVIVDYTITGGDAVGGGVDYSMTTGTLSISPGSTVATILFDVVDDDIDEEDETIEVTLFNPSNADLVTSTVFTYTIIDNDTAPAGGGGGGGIPVDPPGEEGYEVSINNGTEITSSTLVTLFFVYPETVQDIALSRDGNFVSSTFFAPTSTTTWSLLSGDGLKTVYTLFRHADATFVTTSDSIVLLLEDQPFPKDDLEPVVDDDDEPEPEEDPPIDNGNNGPVIIPDVPSDGGSSGGGRTTFTPPEVLVPVPVVTTTPVTSTLPITATSTPTSTISFVTTTDDISEPVVTQIQKKVTQAVQGIQVFTDNPIVEEVTREIVAPVVVSAVVAAVAPSLWSIIFPFLRYIFLQPLLLFRRRKRLSWGVVYNSLTKLPLSLAIVRLVNVDTKKVMQSRVTDKHGRYLFLPHIGAYRLEVEKSGFVFPSIFLKKESADGDRLDIYHGDTIKVTEGKDPVTPNIPVDPADQKISLKKLIFTKRLRTVQFVVSVIGIFLSLASFIITPVWYIGVFLVVHLILFALFVYYVKPRRPVQWGIVRDDASGDRVSNVVVRLFTSQYHKLVATEVTDRKGRYAFLVGKNDYYVTFEKEGYTTHTQDDIFINDDEAIIRDDIYLHTQ
ncbi:MAG: hypothetical protein HN726_01645 [Candidatus Magasanikbacteria bacterium]|jgi:hypothetical protein|nr:hypothetical protein [Candidatus Magasanikbacteria bacterium]MBT4350116.1 hypothetical protein [Candidatus Magasanikbacteria bacterium]MBT4541441.1 hypothetical protein [Candidatus Magasanikbacteria bacterium]MBT6252969.1 hypothetical protein [Candidatus Magasanikbacteria bacterium]MBT7754878.1 hypothetical protein [Candidatus Magasanikbacteria bacterium]